MKVDGAAALIDNESIVTVVAVHVDVVAAAVGDQNVVPAATMQVVVVAAAYQQIVAAAARHLIVSILTASRTDENVVAVIPVSV